MGTIRVYELAKELGKSSKELVDVLKELGVPIKSHSSSIDEDSAEALKKLLKSKEPADESPKKKKTKAAPVAVEVPAKPVEKPVVAEKPTEKAPVAEEKKREADVTRGGAPVPPADSSRREDVRERTKISPDPAPAPAEPPAPLPARVVEIPGADITVKDFAEKAQIRSAEIIKALMMKGVGVTINQRIDISTAIEIGREIGLDIRSQKAAAPEKKAEAAVGDSAVPLKPRPPVVTIMGHVDHGKTKLLDAIRKSDIVATEAGGITQHIGAYQVDVHGRSVTFLDTPGHEAFTALRARGARVTDIAILVVAADDGVKPQTIEAIHHAKAAEVPIIVAINKVDKPDAQPDRVKQQLTEHELVPEEWGGQVIMVPVSAKQVKGIDNLLEMILLVADVQELKAPVDKPAEGIVIESKLDKNRGPVATILIKSGSLKVGDAFVSGTTTGKVRALLTDRGARIIKATPSMPVEILGFESVPNAGDAFDVMDDEKKAREIAETRRHAAEEEKSKGQVFSLESFSKSIKEGNNKTLNLILKADVHGSIEAITGALAKLAMNEISVHIIHSGAGDITESDIMLARASQAIVVGFGVNIPPAAKLMADREGVDTRLYTIIYNLVEDVKLAMEGLLEPEMEEVVIGHAEVRQIFKSSKAGIIAGSHVEDGKLVRGTQIRVFRGNKEIYAGVLDSLKRFKDDAKEVAAGFECGIVINDFQQLAVGDKIEAFQIQRKVRAATPAG